MTRPAALLAAVPRPVRFAAVGVLNTGIDVGLFWLLHVPLGITLANLCSTSAGMAFSFVVNGLVTFEAQRLTLRQALLFVSTTGVVMWVFQPVVIHLLLLVVDPVIVAKVLAIGCSLVVNFAAYRFVVWPRTTAAGHD
ncbi:GtrA family protein [Nocardioides zeae]|uniref:GtrA family protein n=1 Tax=Nocardioides imazamoxiresistens TaxID=3231893 RepID=A0ABU3Q011_9ACTN|nr:GtrA family protein [Nocardioides zeae]MDT9594804.1 GtrA family protein [Nocardioides zeae]